MRQYLLIFGLLIAGLFIVIPLMSQNITDPESEFQRVRTIAFNGDYASAATAARKLVNMFPTYGDARILLGRIFHGKKTIRMLLLLSTLFF